MDSSNDFHKTVEDIQAKLKNIKDLSEKIRTNNEIFLDEEFNEENLKVFESEKIPLTNDEEFSSSINLDHMPSSTSFNDATAQFEPWPPLYNMPSSLENIERTELRRQLDNWLSAADLSHGPARAIIAPHAGYTYCGACGAYAYRQVSPATVKRIFILGPSHHVRLRGCALSVATKYKTPLYDLKIDTQINAQLEETDQFSWMDMKTDEDEHSIEMHLPYIAKVMEDYKDQFSIVPVLVGSISPEQESLYGDIFAQHLTDPQNLFVISSDFCHWGQRFHYTYYDKTAGPIYKSIEKLDRMGMDIIETLDPSGFNSYLRKYNNTICGRHPIGVLLNAINRLKSRGYTMNFKFLQYAQSSQCQNMQDSSVSYASGSLIIES